MYAACMYVKKDGRVEEVTYSLANYEENDKYKKKMGFAFLLTIQYNRHYKNKMNIHQQELLFNSNTQIDYL